MKRLVIGCALTVTLSACALKSAEPTETLTSPTTEAALTTTTPNTISASTTPVDLIMYGDSIGREIYSLVTSGVRKQSGGKTLSRVFSGSSPCQWIETAEKDVAKYQPKNVVILFVGNLFAECMNGAKGDPQRMAGMRKTVRDSGTIAAMFPESKIYFVGFARLIIDELQLDSGTDVSAADYRNMKLRELADSKMNYHYIDGADLLYDKDAYADYLPCKWFDKDHCSMGVVRVRATDGVHLCPNSTLDYLEGNAPCPTHNSGAIRLARQVLKEIS
jgi:hypothetical protein